MSPIKLRNRLGLGFDMEDAQGESHVTRSCVICHKPHTAIVQAPAYTFLDSWESWHRGKLVQDAFPDVDADTREFFISGICPPCFGAATEPVCEEEENEALQDELEEDDAV